MRVLVEYELPRWRGTGRRNPPSALLTIGNTMGFLAYAELGGTAPLLRRQRDNSVLIRIYAATAAENN